ncbi:MAG: glycerol-3-phosphate acyltransferase [Ruminococcaceae bacterium]|nr:glycerol-3-phosphate acyltransferase [Oscillospiraceae bacterium]
MIFSYFAAAVIGYLFGCSSMALYLSKWKGIDLRQGGSKNLGASNALMLMGWKAAVLVGAHDIGKAWLAIFMVKRFFPDVELVGFIAGVSCVLGHMYPFYLKFKGGKGFAAYIGMMLALNFKAALVILAVLVILTLITDYIVVGTVTTVVGYPAWVAYQTHSIFAVCLLLVATGAILYKHRVNCVRIANGTEPGFRRAGRGGYRS